MSSSTTGAQLVNYGFTVRGNAYELDLIFKSRPNPMQVTALTPSSTSIGAYVALDKCPTDFSAEADAKPPGTGQSSFLVIGVVPVTQITRADNPTTVKRGIVGETLPPHWARPNLERPAVRVVTPITTSGGPIRLYALLDKDHTSGLCHAALISHERVYYFSEYRTSHKAIHGRRKEWTEKVSLAIQSLAQGQHPEVEAPEGHPGPVILGDPASSLVQQCITKLSKVGITKGEKEVVGLLELFEKHLDSDLSGSQLQLFDILQSLLHHSNRVFTEDDATNLSENIHNNWHIREATPDRLLYIHRAIKESALKVRTSHARAFLAMGCPSLAETNTDNPVKTIVDIAKHVDNLYGNASRVDIPLSQPAVDAYADYVDTTIRRIEELQDLFRSTADKMKAAHGTTVMPPETVYRRLPYAHDADERRLLHDQAVAHWAYEYGKVYRAGIEFLGNLIQNLKELSFVTEAKE